ncbi:MAG: hypothetical protein JXB35_13360 [Anaerolineae bacterium]|nr:hypothetical protein [Anaerolineae bacterium]
MKRFLTADTVLQDIEFELVQGAISRDDIGRSIRLLKKHQSRLREAYFNPAERMDRETLVARQFQLNDMLFTLLQEMAADARATRLELRKFGEMTLSGLPAERAEAEQRMLADMWLTSELDPYLEGWPPQDLEEAMLGEKLLPQLVLQPSRIPLIGTLLNRLRIALHKVAIFYVTRLAEQQVRINASYGSWIERLVRHSHEQQEKIRILSEQVATLQAHLETLHTETGVS